MIVVVNYSTEGSRDIREPLAYNSWSPTLTSTYSAYSNSVNIADGLGISCLYFSCRSTVKHFVVVSSRGTMKVPLLP